MELLISDFSIVIRLNCLYLDCLRTLIVIREVVNEIQVS
jgi:hypothetical protein